MSILLLRKTDKESLSIMKSVILFRCHEYPVVCANKVAILKHFNPELSIYGLFGGKTESAKRIRKAIGDKICHWYGTGKTPKWNWQHGDLAVREWYRNYGHTVDFDRLYLIEWDLLLLDSLERLYSHVPSGAIAVTARFPLKEVDHEWGWMMDEPYKSQWKKLLATVIEEYDYKEEPLASLGPGTCFSRLFLEKYSEREIPEITNDEQRVPLFAQCFQIPVLDTKFRTSWSDPEDLQFFNCQCLDISFKAIHTEMAKPSGRRVFHPVRKPFSLQLENL